MSRQFHALAGITLILGGSLLPSMASAQNNRVPGPNASRVLVTVFRSGESGLGVEAAEAVHDRVNRDFSIKDVYVLPKEDITAQLEGSGFPTTEALEPYDQKALATLVRADEYLTGDVTKTETGVKVTAQLVLSRDNSIVQPLGTYEAKNVKDAAKEVSRELKEARKQLEFEKKCTNLGRQGEYDEAIAAADAGIAVYPNATMVRACKAQVMISKKASPRELLEVANEITKLDPENKQGLAIEAQAYRDLDKPDSAVVILTKLLATDPKNPRLQKDVVDALTSMADPAVARPIIDQAVEANPGDMELLRTRWIILLGQGDYAAAFTQGEELTRIDSSFADTTYFIRTARAYAADSQPAKAAEIASRGLQKFPNQPSLVYEQILSLQKAGQLQQALDALNQATAAKVEVENSSLMRVLLLKDLGQDVGPAVKAAIADGDTTSTLRALLLSSAQDSYKKATASKADADFDTALEQLKYANDVATPDIKAQAQFLLGATYFSYALKKAQEAGEAQQCLGAQSAKDMLVEAQILLPAGGRFSPEATQQLLGQLPAVQQYTGQVIAAYCK